MLHKLAANTRNSVRGLFVCWREHSFRIETYGLVMAVLLLIWLKWPLWKSCVAVSSVILVLTAEAFNTAIEIICDRVSTKKEEAIRQTKDVASAGVFLAVIIMFFIWIGLAVY